MNRQVNRLLHDEHMHVRRLLERLGAILRHDDAGRMRTAEGVALLRELEPVLNGALPRHFKLEEDDLFPILEGEGDDDIVGLLKEDHDVLLRLAVEVGSLVRRAQEGELSGTAWQLFRRLGAELVERQIDHIEKEEMALLPLLEDAIDGEADRRISGAYGAN